MKLLLAEDDRDISRAVATLLERSNYTVDVVYNGNDALDYLTAGDYDAAVDAGVDGELEEFVGLGDALGFQHGGGADVHLLEVLEGAFVLEGSDS